MCVCSHELLSLGPGVIHTYMQNICMYAHMSSLVLVLGLFMKILVSLRPALNMVRSIIISGDKIMLPSLGGSLGLTTIVTCMYAYIYACRCARMFVCF